MKTITIDLINDNALRLLKNLELLKIIRLHKNKKEHKILKDGGDSKKKILTNLTQAFKDAQRFREGKLKTTSAKDFLNELRG